MTLMDKIYKTGSYACKGAGYACKGAGAVVGTAHYGADGLRLVANGIDWVTDQVQGGLKIGETACNTKAVALYEKALAVVQAKAAEKGIDLNNEQTQEALEQIVAMFKPEETTVAQAEV